jgi:hypothetical protein
MFKTAVLISVLPFLCYSASLNAQPVIDLQPQLPWNYDPTTGTQVGPWEMEVVLTDATAPIVAYSVLMVSNYSGFYDVPYYGFNLNSPGTPFLEWDVTGTPAETADYISPLNVTLNNADTTGCSSGASCYYQYSMGVIFSTSAPFTEVDFSAGASIGTIKYLCEEPIPNLITGLNGAYWATRIYSSLTLSLVTYNNGTEGFFSTQAQVDHPLTRANSFRRGDVNASGAINITDAMLIFFYAFLGDPIACLDVADVNDDGAIDISDPIYILVDLYEGGPGPPAPNSCGIDPTPDALECANDVCP